MTFQVGDRVRLMDRVGDLYGDPGAEGVVKAVHDGAPFYYINYIVVEFDTRVVGGHDCQGLCAPGRGLWLPPSYLYLITSSAVHGARSFGEFIRKQEQLARSES